MVCSGADGASDAPSASGVELDKSVEDEALKRQIEPKGDPTPVELPPKAQKAAQVRLTFINLQPVYNADFRKCCLGEQFCAILILQTSFGHAMTSGEPVEGHSDLPFHTKLSATPCSIGCSSIA